MAVTKHKFFKIELDNNSLEPDKIAEKEINEFLLYSNNVYVNHSLTVLNENQDLYGENISMNKELVISLIYKDLADTKLSIEKASKKVKKVVRTEIEKGQQIEEPDLRTDFENKIIEMKEKPK